MAISAIDSNGSRIFELVRLLEFRPGRLHLAIRLALVCAFTGLITQIYQTPDAALTIYVAFFLNQKDRATTLKTNAVFIIVITAIVAFIFLVARFVIDDPMWRIICIAGISIGILFLTSASKLKPIGSVFALIVAYALDVLGTIPVDDLITRTLLYTWLMVGIPIGVSVIVNLLFAPSPRHLIEQTIAWRLRLGASMLQRPDARIRARFAESLREGNAEIQSWLQLVILEKSTPLNDVVALRQASRSTLVLMSAIDLMDRHIGAMLPPAMRVHLAQILDGMAGIFETGSYPIEISLDVPDPPPILTPIAARVFADVANSLVHFADIRNEQAGVTIPEEKNGFFVKDAFSNPVHIQYALKTTTAAVFCYLLYSLLDWPGIHTCFITCYIVSLGTAAETAEKLTLRILGCLVGAVAGYGAILYLLPDITSIGALMLAIFLGALCSAYVAAGRPRISYAGFQIAFAFFLCVVQGPAPAFDLTIARDRVVGILLGNIVTYLVMTRIAPVSVTHRIDPAIAVLLRRLSTLARSTDFSLRPILASEGQVATGAIELDLQLARYEPVGLRPADDWILLREAIVSEVSALEAPLLLAVDEDCALRLERLADAICRPDTQRDEGTVLSTARRGPLTRLIYIHLAELERMLTLGGHTELPVGPYAPI